MAYQFLRKYRLVIGEANSSSSGTKQSLVITDLHIEFDIRVTQKSNLNTLELKIFNLSKESIAVFDKKDVLVSLYVGYGDEEPILLFRGNKTYMETLPESPNIITRVLAADGYVAVREGRTSTTKPEGSTVEEAIRGIISDGFPDIKNINMNGDTLKRKYNGGYAFSGGAKQGLDKITSDNNLEWHIVDNDTINIFPKQGSIKGEALVLTPQSGLIETVEQTRQDIKTLKKELGADSEDGIKFKMFLNPTVKAGKLISVQGTFASDGVYKVHTVTHSGSYEGDDWSTQVEARTTTYQVA